MKKAVSIVALLMAGLILGTVHGQQQRPEKTPRTNLETGKTTPTEEIALNALAHGRLA